MEPDGEASGSRCDHCPPAAGQNKPQAQQASSPNQGRAEHSWSNRAPGRSGGNHRTQQSGYHSRQPHDLAAVTSKPRNLPQPDCVELVQGKAAAHAVPVPGAGHDAQGLQLARSHVSLSIVECVDPLKDDTATGSTYWRNPSSTRRSLLRDQSASVRASTASPFRQNLHFRRTCPSTPEQ
jgi:hypothetical protein